MAMFVAVQDFYHGQRIVPFLSLEKTIEFGHGKTFHKESSGENTVALIAGNW